LRIFLLTSIYVAAITFFISSPWQPKIFNQSPISQNNEIKTGTVLDSGGTESGDIRKIVWTGAFDLFKKYPVFGSGVETFAFAYYQTRPMEHNLTSEWNFLYNKAHNEYLNYLSTTGVLGITTYLSLIFYILYLLNIKIFKDRENIHINSALLSGFISILITNFFGFSTVGLNVLLFIFPAIFIALKGETDSDVESTVKQFVDKVIELKYVD